MWTTQQWRTLDFTTTATATATTTPVSWRLDGCGARTTRQCGLQFVTMLPICRPVQTDTVLFEMDNNNTQMELENVDREKSGKEKR